MRHSRFQPFAALTGLLVTSAALACPDCPTAQVVRASVGGEAFWSHLTMVGVPFLLVGGLSAILYRIGLVPEDVSTARASKEPENGT
ncbi:MAG TPA: hypothetical protein VEY88_21265 [Archangium sp.]|nr:hypothetical protein [Archangium sp.]